MKKLVFTGLNLKGRCTLMDILNDNLEDVSLVDNYGAFENDIDFDKDSGHFELSGQYTKTGNPITYIFLPSEMVSELVEL